MVGQHDRKDDADAEARAIEDSTYLKNALDKLKLSKAFDFLAQPALSHKYASRAFKIVEQLENLRKEQSEENPGLKLDYSLILAPFYYKLGDSLSMFIESNTDEFGNVQPLEISDSEDEEDDNEEEDENEEDDD